MGVIHLPVAVYHVGFVDYVYKLLQAVCWNCSELLGDADDVRLKRHKDSRGMVKFTQVSAMGKGRFKCGACGLYQPKYSKKSMLIERTWTPKKLEQIDEASPALGASARRLFTPSDALEIFKGMSPESIRSMGMDPDRAHPASMIMQNMAVLPPNARPAIMASEGSKRRGQDDITNQTQDVVKTIRSLRAAIVANMLAGVTYDPLLGVGADGASLTGAAAKKRGGGNAATKMAAATAAAAAALKTSSGGGTAAAGAAAPKPSNPQKKTAAKKRKAAGGGGGGDSGSAQNDWGSTPSEMVWGEEVQETLPLDLDVETQRVFLTEYNVGGHAMAPLTDAGVIALKFAKSDEYFSVSADQAAAIWTAHPVLCEKLQNDVTVLYDNAGRAAPQSQQRSGAPKRSLMNRLTGKTGQIRGAAVAKRCDQNARTVIAPDRFLDVDEIGVPDHIMNILTIPEDVNVHNMADMQDAVRRGPGVANGAARILHTTGQLTQLSMLAPGEAPPLLQVGDIVERHLRDGDRGGFNRQPSLHRLSFLAPRLRRVPGLAFRVPLGAVGNFNADFDGDEMNLHIFQSIYALAEAAELIAVSRNVINPQNNAPCLSIVQDARVGAMLLTAAHTRLGLDVMHQCVGVIRYKLPGKEGVPPPAGTDPATGQPYWTGKQLVSLMLPPIFLERRVRGAGPEVGPDDPNERYVLIRNGVLERGTLCKATLGTGSGSIIHKICTEHGEEAVVRFISDFQRVLYEWLPTHGLTIGLRDCMVGPDIRAHIRACTDNADVVVASLAQELDNLAGDMTETELACAETHILTILTSVLDYTSRLVLSTSTGKVVAEQPDDPFGLMAMVLSASKGNTNNIAQIMACLGQQVIEGQRVGVSAQTRRTLTMFRPGAFSAAARGFIRRAYVDGMEPHEYFFHMMGGREGLVATAVKTAETGYKYRSMTKGMETNVIQWDMSVRNAQGYIIQFVAGGDAFDPTRVERVGLGVLTAGDAQVRRALGPHVPADYTARVLQLRDFLREGILTPFAAECNTKVLLPLNIQDELVRLEYQLQGAAGRRMGVVSGVSGVSGRSADGDADGDGDGDGDGDLAWAVLDLVEVLADQAPCREALAALELAVLYECRPSVLRKAGIRTAALFTATLGRTILNRTQRALCHPGDSVGVIAGQSIGEPATQFTLNVFHSAGLMQRLLTVGVPRLKELLHATETIRTPSMLVPFKDRGAGMSPAAMKAAAASLQFLCIDSVLSTSYPQLDPPGDGVTTPVTTMSKDAELMEHATVMYGPETGTALSPWILRLVLNKAVLLEHLYTPEKVARLIATQMNEYTLSIVYSQPNMPHWVVRIRIDGDVSEAGCRKFHAELRETILLGGVDGIRQARVISVTRPLVDPVTQAVSTEPQPVVDTEGSGLMKVATRSWVDWEGVVTNDVQEVVRTLGMAAGRQLLYAELERAISYDGGYIDPRHIKQVVDTMTHRGYMMPYTRHGINRVDFSVIQRASYEEPVDMLLQGAMTAETDMLRGLCECVVFGQKPPIGTGTVEIQRQGVVVSNPEIRSCPVSREQDLLRGKCKRFRRNLGGGGVDPPPPDKRVIRKDVWALPAVDLLDNSLEDGLEPEGFRTAPAPPPPPPPPQPSDDPPAKKRRLLSGLTVTSGGKEGGLGGGSSTVAAASPLAGASLRGVQAPLPFRPSTPKLPR
jgi:DNA-directed RNA polymerase beta' subunit